MSQEIENQEDYQEDEAQEEEETQDEETQEEESEDNLAEELEARDKKIKELEALIVKKKHSAKPAEKKIQEASSSELSQKELYTLIKNNVHEDDIDEVVEYAQLKKIDVREALKSSVIKAILKDKEETRKTAEVSNTGNTRKGSTSKDADTLVAKARKGELPSSPEDMVKVFERISGLDRLDK